MSLPMGNYLLEANEIEVFGVGMTVVMVVIVPPTIDGPLPIAIVVKVWASFATLSLLLLVPSLVSAYSSSSVFHLAFCANKRESHWWSSSDSDSNAQDAFRVIVSSTRFYRKLIRIRNLLLITYLTRPFMDKFNWENCVGERCNRRGKESNCREHKLLINCCDNVLGMLSRHGATKMSVSNCWNRCCCCCCLATIDFLVSAHSSSGAKWRRLRHK